MFSLNNKISVRQLQTLLILDIFGMGITFLPRKMAEFAGQDGWLCVFIGAVLACFCAWIISSLAELFPSDDFVTYTSKIVSKPIGIIISIGFIVKIIFSLSMEIRIFSEIVKQTILFNTPVHIISFCMLLLGIYGASKGYEVRGRISEILIFVILIPLFVVFCFVAIGSDYTNLMPFFESDAKELSTGGIFSLFTFSGLEFILLAYPYLNNTKSAKKESIKAVGFIGVIMVLITVITISKFGPFDIKNQIWPVLELMDAVDIPGAFLERQDAVVMSFWIMSIFIIVNAGLFFSALLAKDTIKKGKKLWYIIIAAVIVFFISLFPDNISEVIELSDKVYMSFGAAYIFVIPLLLLIIAKIRKLGDGFDEKGSQNI